jgi:Tfp pilus assembly protein PilX
MVTHGIVADYPNSFKRAKIMSMPTNKPNPMRKLVAEAASPLDNQNGSVIVLVLMVLTIMTVLGIVSSDSLVTENYIVRNLGIHQQNVSLLDSALMRGLQEFMQISDADADNFSPTGPNAVWINNASNTFPAAGDPEEFINTIWYENVFTQRCLDAGNSQDAASLPLLATRGENANGNLRYAVVGFGPVDLGTSGIESLVVGSGAVWHQGRILSEYVSADAGGNDNGNGMLRMEIGVKRMW